ncbi:MAG: DUF3786 domain-containing protein [Deltaproteobacteria bacterium]|jgi:hypothetical protein|nr:DUF3786 domain-containing protein [Deltaproteobacteria bacterium]
MTNAPNSCPPPDGYEKNYQLLRSALAQADFGDRARELGFEPVAGGARLSFLGRAYHLDPQEVRAVDGQPSLANHRSLLIHYILSSGQGGPGSQYLTLWQGEGFIRGRRDPGVDILTRPLLEAFAADYLAFQKAAQALGGQKLEAEPGGWREWLFPVLPRVWMKVGYLPADEEFPTEVRAYFDDLAPTYLGFECLAFLCAVLCQALAAAKEE